MYYLEREKLTNITRAYQDIRHCEKILWQVEVDFEDDSHQKDAFSRGKVV